MMEEDVYPSESPCDDFGEIFTDKIPGLNNSGYTKKASVRLIKP